LDTKIGSGLGQAESALRQTETQLGVDNSPTAIPADEEIASVRTAIANRDDAARGSIARRN
jgi:hypothetical protein